MSEKLRLINIGDVIRYHAEGVLQRSQVHGWSWWHDQHCVIVGSTYREQRIPLDRIVARERLHGAGQGIVEF